MHVLQGESEMAAYNKTLGKFQLVGIPPAPRGMPQIEVAFDIDANGIINVSAKDLGTGNEQQIRIEGGSGLKSDEVERMMKDAEAHAGEAHKLRELAEARNQAENLVYQTEKSLKEHRETLSEADASTIEGRIMELKGVLDTGDLGEIKAKTDALGEASHKLAEAVYAQATRRAGARRSRRRRRGRAGRGRGRRGRRLRGRRRRASRDRRARAEQEVQEVDELAALTRERDEYLDRLQRLKAEFDNYRKRAARDQESLVARATERLVKELLPVLDDLERALEAAEKHEEAKLEEGVRARAPRASRHAGEGGPRRDRDGREVRSRTCTRRCSRSRPRRTRAA